MKIIIMGCGRVGSQASQLLAKLGHDVTVIDHDNNAPARLGPDFKGKVVPGVGFDRNVLLAAGIETTEAFVAASSSDNANIIAARIARNIFRVPRVIARLYDRLSLIQTWTYFMSSRMEEPRWFGLKSRHA